MAHYKDSDDDGRYETKQNKKGFISLLGIFLICAVGFLAYTSDQ